MERKRARYNGPTIDCNNKENLISKKTYIFLSSKRGAMKDCKVKKCKQEDCQQSCIFDPNFTVYSSSSNSGDSNSSNEWVNCDDDAELGKEKQRIFGKKIAKYVSTDTVSVKEEASSCSVDLAEIESSICHPSQNKQLLHDDDESTMCFYPSYKSNQEDINQTNKSSATGKTNCNASVPFMRSKVQVYKSRVEPCFTEKHLLENEETLLSDISKLYIGGYNELNLAACISESESSVYSEDSTKRAIKSILKRSDKNQTGDNPKKRVRFDLDGNHQLPLDSNAITEKTLNNETKSTPVSIDNKFSVEPSKEDETENNVNTYSKECTAQTYFTNEECLPKPIHNDEVITSYPPDTQECEEISYDRMAFKELLEGSLKFQKASTGFLKRKRIKSKANQTAGNRNHEKTNIPVSNSISYTSIGIQSDLAATDFKSDISSKSKLLKTGGPLLDKSRFESTEYWKTSRGSQSFINEDEYSPIIRDLVTGSGDRLAKFLVNLSAEISSKSGDAKVANALMNGGFVRENSGSQKCLKRIQKQTLNDEASSMDLINTKTRMESMDKTNRNCFISNKRNERNYFMDNRRSMSEINIHQLKSKEPCYNSYMAKRFHSSRTDQYYIKKTNDDSIWHGLSKYNPNANMEVMGKLCEIMKELKKNVDQICRKESKIHIENAQIWLKDSKIEKNLSTNVPRKSYISEKTKETYSQTIETIDVHLGDHIKRHAMGKTEILIVSNSKNEEINIQLNEKSKKNSFGDPAIESKENHKKNVLNDFEERKLFFDENKHVPFNIVFNNKTHLPTLKKGKYEVEVFEKMDGQAIHETNFKTFMKKITGNMNGIKLNGIQNFDKPRKIGQYHHSSKSTSSQNSKQDKSLSQLVTTFLNRIFKLKINTPDKNSKREFLSSQRWDSTDEISVLQSLLPDCRKERKSNPINNGFQTPSNIDSFEMQNISSNCIECEREQLNIYEEDPSLDVIKTRYPNGMVHFGPLTLMPEPSARSYEMQCMEMETCCCPTSGGCHQYIYNKHRMKSSRSRTLERQRNSLEEFSETKEEFYHQWSQMGKI